MMVLRSLVIGLVLAGLAGTSSTADAQFWKKVKETAKRAAQREVLKEVEETVTGSVRCAFDNLECIRQAEAEGKAVETVDADGNVVSPAGATSSGAATALNANYDFEPGTRLLFAEDFTRDNVGDFPRRMELVRGNWEIVEWQGRRFMRNTGPRGAAIKINLPSTLPERYTIETEVYFPHGNQQMVLFTTPPERAWNRTDDNFFKIAGNHGTGIEARATARDLVRATSKDARMHEGVVPIRIMVDGRYAKVFVGERRVANVPNASLPRSGSLYLENVNFADEKNAMLIGPIRVAAGGKDLYEVLATDGRVTADGILFDTGSHRIRPESRPVLQEIGAMLREHPELRLNIVGHTDNAGSEEQNRILSRERAGAVMQHLVREYGIAQARLRAEGKGPSEPVTTNDTPAGRQQNRRVELVRM